MFEVSVRGSFKAAHQLRLADGSCEVPHRHEWQVQVTFAGDALDETGLLVDFGPVRDRLRGVLAGLDGRSLNDLLPFERQNPSAENVAVHIAEQMSAQPLPTGRLCCVEVEEEPGCVARYRPPPIGGRP